MKELAPIFFESGPYQLAGPTKDPALLERLQELGRHHSQHCESYRRLIELFYPQWERAESLTGLPYLPVSLFKQHDLVSVPPQTVFKILTSSGTTSQAVSRIFLDKHTALLQSRVLSHIMTSFLGPQRLPMLIIDSPSVIKDRKSFSARGAGILGMMNFGRDPLYALNEDMSLNREALSQWLEKHRDQPLLLFGFTFMVWKHFVEVLRESGLILPLEKAVLIHSGGWKKLKDSAVGNTEFKQTITRLTGLTRVHNFYGMVEQVGSVFVECEQGYFHTPSFAEVVMRNPVTWEAQPVGAPGIVQVLSALPLSYPGHSLLTEDQGILLGQDDCRCGRLGSYFQILGRVEKTELRGCSDTYSAPGAVS